MDDYLLLAIVVFIFSNAAFLFANRIDSKAKNEIELFKHSLYEINKLKKIRRWLLVISLICFSFSVVSIIYIMNSF